MATSMDLAVSDFPLGVFEDGNMLSGKPHKFETMIKDVQAHGLDSVMFTNNFVQRDASLLSVSDRLGANIYMMPAGDLYRNWWPDTFPADIETARSVAKPIVEQWSSHPSLKGYVLIDEPRYSQKEKVALLAQAFHELDPARPAMPILIGINRVGPIFEAAQPAVLLINVYPAGYDNAPCDFTLTGMGYRHLDFVRYTRLVTQDKPAETPLWMILQTHQFADAENSWLRTPLPAEVRMQHWLAIGEGATGIFWFIYSSQQSWIGLSDNPALYTEIAALARRTQPLRALLPGLHKVEDRFIITGKHDPYISTLASREGTRTFAVAVNRDCQRSQALAISAPGHDGWLRDVESSQIYRQGTPVVFRPGDGRLFELVTPSFLPIILP